MTPVRRTPHPRRTALADESRSSRLTDVDLYLFNEGTHFRLYEKLGAHPDRRGGSDFAVWAPNAEEVSVIGDFNGWTPGRDLLYPVASSGIFAGAAPAARAGSLYKYHIRSRGGGYQVDKADPVGFGSEVPPGTASRVTDLQYDWRDQDWMRQRGERLARDAPVSIYEVHVGSWRRVPEEKFRSLGYREIAEPLCEYVREMGFTHVEFLPLTEHPFYGSWGYEPTGFFAPTSRYGPPRDLMYLVDELHRADIGTILDWVPSHFPSDEHALGYFDGTHLYEHADARRGWHPDWHTLLFNYGRNEVRSFLLSSAAYWLDVFHMDGLRFDGVASMLYLDYSRKPGEWLPNPEGGRENLEAIHFLRQVNEMVYGSIPGTQTIAEESTAWPSVSRPTWAGGLGFGYKWDMGWMHDTLGYFQNDPLYRRYHQDELTFRAVYAFHENFILPLSHDEVVYGKGSLLERMPGDDWQKFANLRTLFAYQFAEPGKKLLFMGSEFGQRREWHHDESLDWHLAEETPHQALQRWVKELNRIHRTVPAMHERDHEPSGFEWVDRADREQSVLSFLRLGRDPADVALAVFNFTPVPRPGYRVGVPRGGLWSLLANSDAPEFGGSGAGPIRAVLAETVPAHGRPASLLLDLPPLAALFLAAPR